MRKLLGMVLAVASLSYGANTSSAQTSPAEASKPVMAVSFAGYDALRGQLEAMGKLVGNPRLADKYEAMLVLLTQGRGLMGLDTTRPWGFVALSDGQEQMPDQFSWLGFLPTKDLKQLAALVTDPATGKPLAPDADGVYTVDAPSGKQLFAVQKGTWTFIAPAREALTKAPADPAPLLGGLDKQYLLAVRVTVKNFPAAMRKRALNMLEAGMLAGLTRRSSEDDDQFAARESMTRKFFQSVADFVNDMDEMQYGLNIDAGRGTAFLDCRLTAVPGSKTAAKLSAYKAFPSEFAGFVLPGAAVNVNMASPLDDDDVAQVKALLTSFKSKAVAELDNASMTPEQTKAAKESFSDFIGVVEKTLDGKKVDCGASVLLKPGASAVVFGGAIAEGGALDKALRKHLGVVAEARPELAKNLKLDAETAGDVHLHVYTQPVFSEDVAKAVGKEVEIVLGVSDKRLYLAAGSGAAKLLKETIAKNADAAAKDGPLGRISISGKAVADFLVGIAPDPVQASKAAMVASMLKQAGDKDHLVYTKTATPNGVTVRVEAEEGLLKALAAVLNFGSPARKPSRAVEKEAAPF